MALERRQRAGLVRAHQAAVADHVGGEDGGETTFHVSSPWRGRLAALGGQKSMPLRRHLNVRVWLKADLQSPKIEVRLSPNFGHSRGRP